MQRENIVRAVPRDSFGSYGAATKGTVATDLGVYSPCVPLANTFPLQSYFDSTVYEKAILRQNPNELIVSTAFMPLDAQDIIGYGLGLHPSSETPVAVRLKGTKSGSPGASPVLILKPGEIIRPSDGPFSGFEWGLPFGWLGGGVANLIVFVTPGAHVSWNNDQREVLFHRLRLPILAPASVTTVATGRVNWPLRFPWPQAYSTSTNQPQFGKPAIAVMPTRVQIIVRLNAVATAATIRFLLAKFDNFTLTSTGTYDTTIGFFDAVVPTNADPAGLAQQTGSFPVLEYTSGALLGGGDLAVVTPVDMDDGTDLATIELDILRYGRL